MKRIAARTNSSVNHATHTSRTASPVAAQGTKAHAVLVQLAFVAAALVCMLMSRPGHASEGIGGRAFEAGSSSLRVPANGGEGIRVPTEAFTVASADIDGFRHQTSPMRSEGRVQQHEEVRRHDAIGNTREDVTSSSTIVEPVTIAVLGFTIAALLAIRRKKNAAAEAALTE